MKNPFEYGSIVEAGAFCNRRKELDDVLRAIENGDRLFLYAERRLGKTSLVKLALSKLSAASYLVIYLDLWPTDSSASFIAAFAAAITEAATSTPQKMLEFAKHFFGGLAPSISLDSEGKPEVRFGIARESDISPTLVDVLETPGKLVERSKKKVVVVMDEFQQLLEYEDDLVERHLRTVMQHQKGVSYVFLGSRKHLIRKMVSDRSRPLYRSGGHYTLGPIDDEHWISFIQKKFENSHKHISEEQISSICRLTQGHPFYTQHLCHALWELIDVNVSVTEEAIEEALLLLLSREDYAYSVIWESLALNQKRLLEGLAMEPLATKVFSADFLDCYELRSPSTAQRAVKALIERDIIDQEAGNLFIVDRFFKLWLQRKHD